MHPVASPQPVKLWMSNFIRHVTLYSILILVGNGDTMPVTQYQKDVGVRQATLLERNPISPSDDQILDSGQVAWREEFLECGDSPGTRQSEMHALRKGPSIFLALPSQYDTRVGSVAANKTCLVTVPSNWATVGIC